MATTRQTDPVLADQIDTIPNEGRLLLAEFGLSVKVLDTEMAAASRRIRADDLGFGDEDSADHTSHGLWAARESAPDGRRTLAQLVERFADFGTRQADAVTPAQGIETVIPYLAHINLMTRDIAEENETFIARMSARGDVITRLNQQNRETLGQITGAGFEA